MRRNLLIAAGITAAALPIALALIFTLVPVFRPGVPAGVNVPAGHTPETVDAYYQYLFANKFREITVIRTSIYWGGPFWIAFWAFLIGGFFFFYSRYVNQAHRKSGELYGASSFAGSIFERIGPVSVLNILLIIVLSLSGIYMIIVMISRGFVY